MRVELTDVGVSIAAKPIVEHVTLHAATGEMIGIIGPNGSGKSTTLRCVYRALAPTSGAVYVHGDPLLSLPPKESARRVAALAQDTHTEFDFTVTEIVAMGRTPHQSGFPRHSTEDVRICAEALRQVGAEHLAERHFPTLSGGEQQRVLVARCLAQQAKVLVLDEPTNHLDIRHQLDVIGTVRAAGVTTIAVLHDLNIAAAYCDRLYVMADGHVVTQGPPAEVLTRELLADVFGVRAEIVRHPHTGAPQLLYSTLDGRTHA